MVGGRSMALLIFYSMCARRILKGWELNAFRGGSSVRGFAVRRLSWEGLAKGVPN